MSFKLPIPPGEFKAYLFDCDGTVADSMPLHYLAWKQALGEWGCDFTEERFYKLGGLPIVEIIQLLGREQGVLRRMSNVAVKKKLLPANPCAGVEFPVAVKGMFRPHYMTWSEQRKIEVQAPEYLRNIGRIITETGLRIYKELMPMTKEQLDLEKRGGLDIRFQNAERRG